MSISAAFEWLQADEKKTSPKHKDNYHHAILSLLCGFLGSVGLGYMAVEYDIVADDTVATAADLSGEYTFMGYLLAIYHLVMILCRTWVKGPEELYNQMWASNCGMALATVGIFSCRRILVGAAVAVVSIDQCLWYIDCILKLGTGKFQVRSSEISGVARNAFRTKSIFLAPFMVLASMHILSAQHWVRKYAGGFAQAGYDRCLFYGYNITIFDTTRAEYQYVF